MKAQINRSCALAISANAFYNERDFKVVTQFKTFLNLSETNLKGLYFSCTRACLHKTFGMFFL